MSGKSSSLSSVSASESASAATWCVWTEEMFEVRRHPFATERGARAALDDWICVRLLTDPRGEVVATRNRWHSPALETIKDVAEAHRTRRISRRKMAS